MGKRIFLALIICSSLISLPSSDRPVFDPAATDLLFQAIAIQDPIEFQQALDLNADWNGFDRQGYTPLTSAAAYNFSFAIPLLVNKGVSVNERDQEGRIPLELAVPSAHMYAVKALLDLGADVEMETSTGGTVLIKAGSDTLMISTLLKAGADVNVKNKEGLTPLLRLSSYAHRFANQIRNGILMLLDAGANVDEKDFQRKTALDHVKYQHYQHFFDNELEKLYVLLEDVNRLNKVRSEAQKAVDEIIDKKYYWMLPNFLKMV